MKARLIVFAAVVSLGTNQEVREKEEEVQKRSCSVSQRVEEYGSDKEALEKDIFQSMPDLYTHLRLQATRICLSQPSVLDTFQ
jgi:hypothetical protein